MREHPIPQDITSYRFHIIGNMTLKQFGELALGVILAVVVYATNLPALIKAPFIVIFIIAGVVAAFVPIAERPLDHWILTFFKVLYKPTLYFWKKDPHIPIAFTYTSSTTVITEPEIDLNPARRQRIKEYISSVSYSKPNPSDYEPDEQLHMQSILSAFDTVAVVSQQTTITQEKPSLDVRVRPMRINDETLDNLPMNQIATYADQHLGQVTITYDQSPAKTQDPNKQILGTDQVAQNIEIPETEAKHVAEQILPEDQTVNQQQLASEARSYQEQAQDQSAQQLISDTALYNSNLPFPTVSTTPNKPVGMVLSEKNDLIVGAIVEIKTMTGTIARAVKTNALGQFFITTPLENGVYAIEVEKTGYSFAPKQLALNGSVVPPLELRGTTVN